MIPVTTTENTETTEVEMPIYTAKNTKKSSHHPITGHEMHHCPQYDIIIVNNKEGSLELIVKRQHPNAKTPTYSSSGAARMDVYLPMQITIFPFTKHVIDLGIAIKFPSFVYGRLASRSGIGSKHSLITVTSVLDSDYRGSIKYVCYSLSKYPYTLPKHTIIAQIILESYCKPSIMIGKFNTELETTIQGSKGFEEGSGIY